MAGLGRLARRGFAWWSLAWGVIYAILFSIAASVDFTPNVILWILGALTVLCIGLGAWILRAVRFGELTDEERMRLRIVTGIARRSGGTVTLTEVVASSGLTVNEARDTLRECVREGMADVDVDDQGRVCWEFRGLVPPREEPARLPWLNDLRDDPTRHVRPPDQPH